MKYSIIKETLSNELGTYTTFGIQNDKGYKISDISTDIKDVEKLVSAINKLQTPDHYVYYEIDRLFADI